MKLEIPRFESPLTMEEAVAMFSPYVAIPLPTFPDKSEVDSRFFIRPPPA
jgi:hypothetical protein